MMRLDCGSLVQGPQKNARVQGPKIAGLVNECFDRKVVHLVQPAPTPPHAAEDSKVALDQITGRVRQLEEQASSLHAQLLEAQKQMGAWQGKVCGSVRRWAGGWGGGGRSGRQAGRQAARWWVCTWVAFAWCHGRCCWFCKTEAGRGGVHSCAGHRRLSDVGVIPTPPVAVHIWWKRVCPLLCATAPCSSCRISGWAKAVTPLSLDRHTPVCMWVSNVEEASLPVSPTSLTCCPACLCATGV